MKTIEINKDDRLCPVCNKVIDFELCYEIAMCLTAGFNPTSVPEVEFTNSVENQNLCYDCPFGDFN